MTEQAKAKPAAKAPKPQNGTAPRVIDLDEARAARAEKRGEPVTLKLGGKQFTLPPELPAEFALLSATGDIREALAALFGDKADAFFATRPSLDDVNELVEQVSRVYGITEGE